MRRCYIFIAVFVLTAGVATGLSWSWNPSWTFFSRSSHPRGQDWHSHRMEKQNKKLVLAFYQEVFGDKNIEAADKYIDENTYIQHNPHVADGREAFKTAAEEWFEGAPKETIEFLHAGADGNLVWVHTKAMHDGHLTSVMDIFRLKDYKIVEHWDVMQAVPEASMNNHPMF